MKAIKIFEAGHLEIIEKEIPKIEKPGEVLVKVKFAGICGSDMHIYHGKNPLATYPRVVGHEFVGEIVKVGDDVNEIQSGDRVVIEPIVYCGQCYACKSGRPNVCETLEVLGVHKDGGFQEYVVVNQANVHKFGDELSWEEAVLIEPYTIAAQATWHGDVKENETVYVAGAGPIGLMVIQFAKLKGATVIVSDLFDSKLKRAKAFGADYTINSSKEDVKEKVMAYTHNVGANVVIDAVGIPAIFEQAVEVASVAGKIVILGFSKDCAGIPLLPITKKEITIYGSRLQTHKFKEVIQIFKDKKINTKDFVSAVYKFDDIVEAIEMIENNSEDICKVLVQFD